MTTLRSHQVKMKAFADEIILGTYASNLLTVDCTCGGGKTKSAEILIASLVREKFVDFVLWVTPRISLGEQIRKSIAANPELQGINTAIADPTKGDLVGESLFKITVAIATYQAISTEDNWTRFRDAVKGKRTLIIFDEVQFLSTDGSDQTALEDDTEPDATRSPSGVKLSPGWYKRAKHVQAAARMTLVMSGTLWRTDGKRIPFVKYELRADGKRYPIAQITYSYADAVAECAILRLECTNRDAVVEYKHQDIKQLRKLLDDDNVEENRKVKTFLSSRDAVFGLLDDMVKHWKEWRASKYQSRAIVMADTIDAAREYVAYLEGDKHRVPCALAVSNEPRAAKTLSRFQNRESVGQCLVTVAMAYIGFDCPDITHLAYLSSYRALSWLLQAFARASRYDRASPLDYAHQRAHIFAPDDARMRLFLHYLRMQQDIALADKRVGGGGGGGGNANARFDPISAILGNQAFEGLEGRIPAEALPELHRLRKTNHVAAGMSMIDLYTLMCGLNHFPRTPTDANGRRS